MIRKILSLTITIFILAGCGSTTSSETTQVSSSLANATSTPNLAPTSTMTSSPQVIPTDTLESVNSCFQTVQGETPLQDVATGTIVLDKGSFPYQTVLLDLKSGIEYELPSQTSPVIYLGSQISPDRNLLAYVEGLQNNDGQFDRGILWVVNVHAEVLEKINFNLPGLYSLRWLDSQRMILYTGQISKDGTVIFFNPFTREQRYISNELPGLYRVRYSEFVDWFAEYSSDLDMVVYFGELEDGETGPVVWDTVAQKAIWQNMDAGTNSVVPLWSPVDNVVAVVDNNGQLYVVGRSGLISQLPELGTQNRITSFSWSPSGDYIAYWNVDPSYEWSRLMIYDVHAGQVADTCVIAYEATGSEPVWSPDSQSLFVHFGIRNDDGSFSGATVLVDIAQNIAFRISRDPKPLDWMNSIP